MEMEREGRTNFTHHHVNVAVWESNVTPTGWDGTGVWSRGGGEQWRHVREDHGRTTGNDSVGNVWDCSTKHGR